MKKKSISRKRSLAALAGCCWLSPSVLQLLCGSATTSTIAGLRQHYVLPAKRSVQYYDEHSQIRSKGCNDVANQEQNDNHSNSSRQSSAIQHREPTNAQVNDELVTGSIWHIHVNANNAEDNVDDLFASLKRMDGKFNANQANNRQSGLFSSSFSSSSLDHLFNYIKRRKMLIAQDESTVVDSDLSLVEKLFVKDSESTPLTNETSQPIVIKQQQVTSGFTITTGTEYNVTSFVDVHVNLDSVSSSSLSSAPVETIRSMNDSSTVIFTAVQELKNGTDFSGFIVSNSTTEEEALDKNETLSNDSNQNISLKAVFRPIRMRAFLSEIAGGGEHLLPSQRQLLLQNMIRPALLAWSSALRVRPVKGNLTVDTAQLHDGGRACGPHNDELPSVSVPRNHLTEGVEDTDVVIYVGLSFTTVEEEDVDSDSILTNPFIYARSNTTDNEKSNDNTTTHEKIRVWKDQTNKRSTGNSKNKTVRSKQKCLGDYMAASTFCSTDQYDRPTAVLLHICIDPTFFFPSNLAANIRAMMHELGHALGFNSVSLAHFRRPDGSPITKRNSDGTVPLSSVQCTGPNGDKNITQRLIPLPSDEILKFRTARNGIRVAEIVTPSVVQVVRNHFDCQNLSGAELESGEVLPLGSNPGEVTCLGDHWERRLFQSDLMNPSVEVEGSHFDPRFSTLTLAYFADSGWYQADLARANYPSAWGRAAGCDFVEEPCVSKNGTVAHSYDEYFCTNKPMDRDAMQSENSSSIQGCTPDLARKASCSLGRHEGDLPPEYQYFKVKYGAEFGGDDPFMDYCPVYSGFVNGLCADSENEAFIRVSKVERFGRRNSRCLASIVKSLATTLTTSDQNVTSVNEIESYTGLCMPIACVVEDRSLRIQVNGLWQTCTQKGEQLVSFLDKEVVTITCPDPVRICPTFYCLRDCLGRSDRRTICDYNAGVCVCDGAEVQNVNNDTICVTRGSQAPHDKGNQTVPSLGVEVDDEIASTPGIFYEANATSEQLPDPDSPLADYYVTTLQGLDKDGNNVFQEVWFWIVVALGASIIAVTIFLCYCRFSKNMGISNSVDAALNTGAGDDQGDNAAAINPDKHKMMANVVVNLRMNDHSLQRRVDAMGDAASVTDISMTDTEGTICQLNDVSVEMSTGTPDLPLDEDDSTSDIFITDQIPPVFVLSEYGSDPLSQPPAQPAQPYVRRRHLPFISASTRSRGGIP